MRAQRHRIFRIQRRIAQPLQNRQVNLRVRMQKGVAWKVQPAEQCQYRNRPRQGRHLRGHRAGVFSSCCLAHLRSGFNCSDRSIAVRASALRPALRNAIPSHRCASADCRIQLHGLPEVRDRLVHAPAERRRQIVIAHAARHPHSGRLRRQFHRFVHFVHRATAPLQTRQHIGRNHLPAQCAENPAILRFVRLQRHRALRRSNTGLASRFPETFVAHLQSQLRQQRLRPRRVILRRRVLLPAVGRRAGLRGKLLQRRTVLRIQRPLGRRPARAQRRRQSQCPH